MMPKELSNIIKNDCGIEALICVLPDLDMATIRRTFMLCSNLWPNGGITNKEYNIALRHIGILNRFHYNDDEDAVLEDFLQDKENTYIILIWKHFTVIEQGDIKDKCIAYLHLPPEAKVYCSWKLLSPSPLS